MKSFISKNLGLVAVIAVVLVIGTWMNESRHKSEPLKPTTIISTPKVETEVGGGLSIPTSTRPLGSGYNSSPKQTEEEVMAAISRNACLQRCPSGSVPVYIGDEVTGFFNFETAHLTNFSKGDRLNL